MTHPEPLAEQERRYRPLGLSIAIAATAFGYGIIPMLPLTLVLWSQITRRSIGADLLGGTLGWITIGLGALTLVVSILAWIGWPYRIRLALLALVWVSTGIQVIGILRSVSETEPLFGVGGSLTNVNLICQVPLLVVVPLYVTWYMNRAPARRFYSRR